MFVPIITTSKTEESDPQGKELVWLAETLVSGLVNFDDVKLYQRAGVFEWLFNITSSIPLVSTTSANEKSFSKLQNSFYITNHARLRELARRLVERAQEISNGSTALLLRSGLLAWVQTEYDIQNEDDTEVVKKLGIRTVLTVDGPKFKEWTSSSDLRTPLQGLE